MFVEPPCCVNTLNEYIIHALTYLHTESPTAFDKLSNVPLTLAVAPRFLEKLQKHNF